MKREYVDYLAECNCFIRVGDSWGPAVHKGGQFYSPSGLKLVTPTSWRSASNDEIVAEMDGRNELPVIMGELLGV